MEVVINLQTSQVSAAVFIFVCSLTSLPLVMAMFSDYSAHLFIVLMERLGTVMFAKNNTTCVC